MGSCPVFALSFTGGGIKWDQRLCQECDNCIKTCGHSSSPRIQLMTAADVITEISAYFPFIAGITLSGGECTLWPEFMTELFEEIKRNTKTTFADSNGFIDFSAMPELLQVMDMAMIDLKAADSGEHKMLTGRDNAPLVDNISYLASVGKLFEIRTVIVPDLLDNHRTVELGSRLIAGYPVRYKLIRYRPLGVRTEIYDMPSEDLMNRLAGLASRKGVKDIIIV